MKFRFGFSRKCSNDEKKNERNENQFQFNQIQLHVISIQNTKKEKKSTWTRKIEKKEKNKHQFL